MARRLLVLLLLASTACAAQDPYPACPSGAVRGRGDDWICGTCTVGHGSGECPAGYICTACALECVYFANGFPLDAGAPECAPIDAGVTD